MSVMGQEQTILQLDTAMPVFLGNGQFVPSGIAAIT